MAKKRLIESHKKRYPAMNERVKFGAKQPKTNTVMNQSKLNC